MHATFQVTEHTDVRLAFQVKPIGLRLYGCMLTFFGVVGVGTLAGYGAKLEDQRQIGGVTVSAAMFLIAGLGLAFYQCGIIFDKQAQTMIDWSRWFGLLFKKVHAWNEIDQFIVSCSQEATTQVTSGTSYPILFRAGGRRHHLAWPWTCGSRQEATHITNQIAAFLGKQALDSSIKAGWSTPQESTGWLS